MKGQTTKVSPFFGKLKRMRSEHEFSMRFIEIASNITVMGVLIAGGNILATMTLRKTESKMAALAVKGVAVIGTFAYFQTLKIKVNKENPSTTHKVLMATGIVPVPRELDEVELAKSS